MNKKKKYIRKLEAQLAQALSSQRRGLKLIEKLLASADRPQGHGIWGVAPDWFWVSQPLLSVHRAYVLLDGRICRVSIPNEEPSDWELVTKETLKTLVDPQTLERILFANASRENLSDTMPTITFPPGTLEKLEALQGLLTQATVPA